MTAEVVIVFGTRPSFIKLWPVWRGLCAEGIEPTVICTGQHDELVRQHMGLLDMPVHQWLEVMRDTSGLNRTLALVLDRVNDVLAARQPRLVIVHGDTTSGLGASVAAYHRGIPVAHVEAGLRSGHAWSPYPEEMNRISIDSMASLLCAPTVRAADSARQTNPEAMVKVTGNPVVDAVEAIRPQLSGLPTKGAKYILLELHRRESFGERMHDMIEAVLDTAIAHHHMVVWPVHPNPLVHEVCQQIRSAYYRYAVMPGRLEILNPQPYPSFLRLVQQASLVLTDSGGVCEEAPSFGVPTLQLRDHTDRPEAIAHQMSWLVGRDPAHIAKLTSEALEMAETWKQSLQGRPNPFGDGQSGPRIARMIREWIDDRTS